MTGKAFDVFHTGVIAHVDSPAVADDQLTSGFMCAGISMGMD